MMVVLLSSSQTTWDLVCGMASVVLVDNVTLGVWVNNAASSVRVDIGTLRVWIDIGTSGDIVMLDVWVGTATLGVGVDIVVSGQMQTAIKIYNVRKM